MSKIDYCKRGGLQGISVTENEMEHLANKLGNAYIDEVIPLPDKTEDEQIKKNKKGCPLNHDDMNVISYWEEPNTGNHGWCCSACGKVIQWG